MSSIILHCGNRKFVPFEQICLQKSLEDISEDFGINWIKKIHAITYKKWILYFTEEELHSFNIIEHATEIITIIVNIVKQKVKNPNLPTSPEWRDNYPRFSD